MRVPLLDVPVTRWECPNCPATDTTRQAEPHSRFHSCPGLAGLSAPMVPAGTPCKVIAHERGDYIGAENVQYDADGRPVASVETVRDDGNDVTVYAPTAHLEGGCVR